MDEGLDWSKDAWEASISSRCWWFTPYDDGWQAVAGDPEMRQLLEMEHAAAPVPPWAAQIAQTSIRSLPACGHYLFPLAYVEAVKAIGSETPSDTVHGCFTVDRDQKRRAQDYCLCLDAWLAGATPDAVVRELVDMGHRRTDWNAICADTWDVLGAHTEAKDLLVERLLHHIRWWVKFAVWDEDFASEFCRDQYLGDYSPTGGIPGDNCYFSRPVPGFDERTSPRVKRLEDRLAQFSPLWAQLRPWMLEEWWLCAPKAFRFLERLLWQIGNEAKLDAGARVPDFLRVKNECEPPTDVVAWWADFISALRAWGNREMAPGPAADQVGLWLGQPAPVKQWLVALFLKKVAAYEKWNLGKLVRPPH